MITTETIAKALWISWRTANAFEAEGDSKMAVFAWRGITEQADGIWALVCYTRGLPEAERAELLDAARTVRELAMERQRRAYHLPAKAA
jgi:hypothetical protein